MRKKRVIRSVNTKRNLRNVILIFFGIQKTALCTTVLAFRMDGVLAGLLKIQNMLPCIKDFFGPEIFISYIKFAGEESLDQLRVLDIEDLSNMLSDYPTQNLLALIFLGSLNNMKKQDNKIGGISSRS